MERVSRSSCSRLEAPKPFGGERTATPTEAVLAADASRHDRPPSGRHRQRKAPAPSACSRWGVGSVHQALGGPSRTWDGEQAAHTWRTGCGADHFSHPGFDGQSAAGPQLGRHLGALGNGEQVHALVGTADDPAVGQDDTQADSRGEHPGCLAALRRPARRRRALLRRSGRDASGLHEFDPRIATILNGSSLVGGKLAGLPGQSVPKICHALIVEAVKIN
jgi:hypothetical protein